MKIEKRGKGMNQKKKKTNFKQWIPFYIMGLPGLIYLFINNYLPLAGLQIAFKNFSYSKGMWASPWCGLKNFKFLFRTADAWIMIRNTLLYNIFWIILGAVLGVTAAILINEVVGKLKKKFYMTAILLPYLMSMVVIAYLVYAYLSPTSGLFTKALERWTGSAPAFYQETKWWPFILTFVNQWRQIGFGMILYMSTILGIDPSLYEAATLDGATRWPDDPHHRHALHPQPGPDLPLRLRSVLSGAYEPGGALPRHPDHRHLCLPRPAQDQRRGHVLGGQLCAVRGGLHLHRRRQQGGQPSGREQQAVLIGRKRYG